MAVDKKISKKTVKGGKKKIVKKKKKVVKLDAEKLNVEVPQEAASGSDVDIGNDESGENDFFWQDADSRRVLRDVESKRQAKLAAAKAAEDASDDEGIIIQQGRTNATMANKKGKEWLQAELYDRRIRTRCPYTLYDRAVVKSRLGQHISTVPKNVRKSQAEAKKNARKQRKADKIKQSRGDLWHLKV